MTVRTGVIGEFSVTSPINGGVWLPTLLVMRPSRMREILAALLTSMPHVHLLPMADDARQALAQFSTEPPDVLMIDWDLSDGGALELLRRVKADYPAARCVMLVNSYQAELMSRSALADAVLFKGFSVNDLLGVMSRIWHERPRA